MKKVAFVFLVLLIFTFSGCGQDKVEIRDYDQDLFELYYETDDFTIMKRIDIDEEQLHNMIGYGIGDGYLLGEYHRVNFYVQVGEDMYYLDDGVKLGLYDGQDLVDIGVPGVSVQNEYK